MASGTDGIQLNNLVNPSHRQPGSDREISSRNFEAERLSSIAPNLFNSAVNTLNNATCETDGLNDDSVSPVYCWGPMAARLSLVLSVI